MRLRSLVAPAALAAAVAAALLAASSGGTEPRRARDAAASAWRGLVGSPRSEVSIGQRMIVVLSLPSLADVVIRHGGVADDASERRWTAAALAAQQQFLAKLAAKGVRLQPEFRFARVLNGFSAALDPRAVAVLERAREVRGVYPVRAAFPAAVSRRPLDPRVVHSAFALRPRLSLAGFDGTGVSIALLDTGVDTATPFLHGHVLPGVDVVGRAPDARAHSKPGDRMKIESHGTESAGILVGAGGPGGLTGIAPGATVFPIRVAGWQRDARGGWQVYGRTDQILAGLERAVDPNADGDAHDSARVALIGLSEPFAAFADDPLARAATGALRLDTLVVAPAGNDGPAGPVFGSVSGPGGAPSVLAVGAADLRSKAQGVRLLVRAGLDVLLDRVVPLAGAVEGSLGTELVAPRRLFDRRGFSAVAGRAALVDAGTAPRAVAEAASEAGATALVFAGAIPPGGLGLDDRVTVPALAIPEDAAAAIRGAIAKGLRIQLDLARPRLEDNHSAMRVAPFSSWGLAFGGALKPELVASGIGVPTAEPGSRAGGGSTFTTVNGSSAAAATVAGAAALLVEARPGVGAQTLRSLLVGTARPLEGDPAAAQGGGVIDAGAAAAAELAAVPASISFGRGSGDGWSATRTVLVRNVSTRRLVVYVSLGRKARTPRRIAISVSRKRLELPPRGSARLVVGARVVGYPRGAAAGGVLTLTPVGGPPVRVPWAVVLAPVRRSLLGPLSLSTRAFAPSEVRPAVLALRAGGVHRGRGGIGVEPVLRLDVELWTAKGKRLGLLARVRDLLPGRYAFGLTGRNPSGKVLKRGEYRLRLVAWPTAGGSPTVRSIGFRIVKPASR